MSGHGSDETDVEALRIARIEARATLDRQLSTLDDVDAKARSVFRPTVAPRSLEIIYGDGEQTRDFTFVGDAVDANRTLLTSDAVDGEVVNIGSTDTITITELAEEIRDQLAPELELVYDEGREVDARHTHADVRKARERFGYEPSTGIRGGVDTFIDWYRENRDWYEPLVRSS